jgi:acyl transferase domain-containing protein
MNEDLQAPEAVAVIGMAGRFPGAQNPDEFWQNLMAGKDGITRFPGRTEADGSKYVGARSMFENPDQFDASFFGIYPKEAELMDPQHRVFLECSWEALESAGYDPAAYPGMIGVYAGLSLNTYLLHNLGKGRELAKNYQVAEYQTMLGNDKDFLPVRVSSQYARRSRTEVHPSVVKKILKRPYWAPRLWPVRTGRDARTTDWSETLQPLFHKSRSGGGIIPAG